MDTYQGNQASPSSLNKYTYAGANPVIYTDPSGYFSITEVSVTLAIVSAISFYFSPINYMIGAEPSMSSIRAIEQRINQKAHSMTSEVPIDPLFNERLADAESFARLMQYAAAEINPRDWVMSKKTRAAYLRIVADQLTSDGKELGGLLGTVIDGLGYLSGDDPLRSNRPRWLKDHADSSTGWRVFFTPDAEDGTSIQRGVTGRRDHFLANAFLGSGAGIAVNMGYRLVENSNNDMAYNLLGTAFGTRLIQGSGLAQNSIYGAIRYTLGPE